MKVAEHWNRLHREVVEPSLLDLFKIYVDVAQGNLL